jgi:uncharacterized SAM-binding protein YcdF (DUF218 family)
MRWALWSAFSPSQVLVYLVILGALLLVAGRVRLGRGLCVLGGAGLLLFGLLPLSNYLLAPLEGRYPQPTLPSQVAGILLLAGAEQAAASDLRGEPQLNAAGSRYTTTLRLAVRYPQARVVFVGGALRDPRTGLPGQTAVARELLPSLGLAAARLSFDARSEDTCDSAINARVLVGPARGENWVVVTSAAHLPRTMACFQAAGWNVIPQPADYQGLVAAWEPGSYRVADNLARLDVALHEWIGLAYYRLSGRTRVLFPGPAGPQVASR